MDILTCFRHVRSELADGLLQERSEGNLQEHIQSIFDHYHRLSQQYWQVRDLSVDDDDDDMSSSPVVRTRSIVGPSTPTVPIPKEVTEAISETDLRSMYEELRDQIIQCNRERGEHDARIRMPSVNYFQGKIIPMLLQHNMGVKQLRMMTGILLEYRYKTHRICLIEDGHREMTVFTCGTDWRFLINLVKAGKSLQVIDEVYGMRQRFGFVHPGRLLEIFEDYCDGDVDAFHDFWDYFDAECDDVRLLSERLTKLYSMLQEVERAGSVERWIACRESGTKPRSTRNRELRQPSQIDRLRLEHDYQSFHADRFNEVEVRKIERGGISGSYV